MKLAGNGRLDTVLLNMFFLLEFCFIKLGLQIVATIRPCFTACNNETDTGPEITVRLNKAENG